jgi:hypothetical protein
MAPPVMPFVLRLFDYRWHYREHRANDCSAVSRDALSGTPPHWEIKEDLQLKPAATPQAPILSCARLESERLLERRHRVLTF